MLANLPESLLVFSDVHLGSDLNDRGPRVPRSAAIDRDLVAMLAYYRARPPSGGRWRLVIAGDFVDFVGMSIDPREGDDLATPLTEAERAFGLGGAEDHARLKLKRAHDRHPEVFAELGGFVAAGNTLTVVTGNHDLEMYWDGVKEDFCRLIGASKTSVDFAPWFFYREGLVYIEHGHQFDPFCAIPYVLAPLSPLDPRRVLESLSDTLLRYIVRRTPGMKEYGHEKRGLASYISWGLLLGARGTAGLFMRFWRAVFSLRRIAKAYDGDLGTHVRAEHQRRLVELAEQERVPLERLHRSLTLHAPPIGRTPRGVLTSVMLDRLGVFCVMVVTLSAVGLFRSRLRGHALSVTGGLLGLWGILHVTFSRGRPDVDSAVALGASARELAKLFPASFVVMGHTHVPATKPIGDATYVNLGSWAEEEPAPNEPEAYRAARTFLVVEARGDRHEARLCAWRSGVGPEEWHVMVRRLRVEPADVRRLASAAAGMEAE